MCKSEWFPVLEFLNHKLIICILKLYGDIYIYNPWTTGVWTVGVPFIYRFKKIPVPFWSMVGSPQMWSVDCMHWSMPYIVGMSIHRFWYPWGSWNHPHSYWGMTKFWGNQRLHMDFDSEGVGVSNPHIILMANYIAQYLVQPNQHLLLLRIFAGNMFLLPVLRNNLYFFAF